MYMYTRTFVHCNIYGSEITIQTAMKHNVFMMDHALATTFIAHLTHKFLFMKESHVGQVLQATLGPIVTLSSIHQFVQSWVLHCVVLQKQCLPNFWLNFMLGVEQPFLCLALYGQTSRSATNVPQFPMLGFQKCSLTPAVHVTRGSSGLLLSIQSTCTYNCA